MREYFPSLNGKTLVALDPVSRQHSEKQRILILGMEWNISCSPINEPASR